MCKNKLRILPIMLIGDIPLRADDKERKQVTSFVFKK